MADSIRVFDFGAGGVNVDANPLALADNELRQSQNATHTTVDGADQALKTRTGFGRFNLNPLPAAILGGIEAPYQGTAGATGAGGGGFPGDAGDTGDPTLGTGAGPGSNVGSPTGGGTLPPGGGLLTTNKKLFNGARLILIGRARDSANSAGWYATSQGFADTPVLLNSTGSVAGQTQVNAGPPSTDQNTAFPSVFDVTSNTRRATDIANGVTYYSEDIFNQSAAVSPTLPWIRRLSADGNSDNRIIQVPDNPAIKALGTIPSHSVCVVSMRTEWANGDAIWIGIYDKITTGGSAGSFGRVLRLSGLDSGAYKFEEVYNLFSNPIADATGSVPYALENYLGRMWVGIWTGKQQGTAYVDSSLKLANGQWTLSGGATGTDAKAADVTCMRSYSGALYFGCENRDPTLTNARIFSVNALGTVTDQVTGSGGTVHSPTAGWVAMEVFSGNLYATYFSYSQSSQIWKYDGTTWSVAYTGASAIAKESPLNLRVDNGRLYAWGGQALSSTIKQFLVTTDGASWTDQTSLFAGNISSPTAVFAAFDQ